MFGKALNQLLHVVLEELQNKMGHVSFKTQPSGYISAERKERKG